MKPSKIIILTGAKQSGKSTALLTWIEEKNVGGFLTPIVSGKRILLSLPDKVYTPFESTDSYAESIKVGRYEFLKSAFQVMNNHLVQQSSSVFDWLVIDEVGPLELNGEGIYPGLIHVLHNTNNSLLLVVREGLVEEVIEKFKLTSAEIILKEDIV